MASYVTTLFFLISSFLATCMALNSKQLDLNILQMAHTMVVKANNWAQLSAHDESSLIFGHHRRHHGGGKRRGGGGGGSHGGLTYDDTLNVDSIGGHHGGHHGGHGDDSTLDDTLIFGHHRHHRRHHGGGGGGGGHGGITDDTLTVDNGRGDHGDDDSTLDDSLILGHHRHHRRHHGGGKGGGGGHGGITDNDTLTVDNGRGDHGDDGSTLYDSLILGHHRRHHGGGKGGGGGHGGITDNDTLTVDNGSGDHGDGDSILDDSLILGHHRHHRRHHGGGKGGGGGHGGITDNDTLTVDNGSGDHGDDDSTLDDSLILGHHRHHRRHHGGGSGGGGGGGGHGHDDITYNDTSLNDSTYNNTLFSGQHRGGNHGDDDSTYDNTLIFGRGKHHGGGGGHGDDSTYNNDTNNKYINNYNYNNQRVALSDCAKLYDKVELMISRMLKNKESYTSEDAVAWLSGAITSHRTCMDGLREKGMYEDDHPLAQNLTMLFNHALTLHAKKLKSRDNGAHGAPWKQRDDQYKGLLSSWNPATSRADIVVAKDGSGNYRTINEAVNALGRISSKRVVVHVKAGVYDENVEIGRNLRNVMFVGEGIDKTVVTGRRNYVDGDTTLSSATFRVLGDGFWARDMTFENTAGPQKHQAVALMVASDNSLFYKCSIKGYQDTLYVHSLRQFYRDCKIYGTVDFIFGNAAVVFQNCDILVRRPMDHQANMITAQGRESPYENTGILIHGSQILPDPEFVPVKGSIKTFLGRPWKKYSRTVVAKTDLDGMIHPKGWTEWHGDTALATLYYAEYMNTGPGASTGGRVDWPGYHVLRSPREVGPFTVRNFIQGESWIMKTGVPVWTEI